MYCERWEIETALDELKTHLRGSRIQLRSKTPDLVRQEFYGLLMTHFAIRGLMHEAAIKGDIDPDKLSFVHAIRVVKRKLRDFTAFPPSAQESAAGGSTRRNLGRTCRVQPGQTKSKRRETQNDQLPHSSPIYTAIAPDTRDQDH